MLPKKPQGLKPPAPQKAMEKAGVGGCDRFQPLLPKYDWDVRIMRAIVQAESSVMKTQQAIQAWLLHKTGEHMVIQFPYSIQVYLDEKVWFLLTQK